MADKPLEDWDAYDFMRESKRIVGTDNADDQALCGAMMLQMIRDGCDFKGLRRVANDQKVPLSRLRPWWRRLRFNGVFQRDCVHADWLDEENGGIAFCLDVSVAMGLLNRV